MAADGGLELGLELLLRRNYRGNRSKTPPWGTGDLSPPGETFDYVVQRGDTLFTIATQHGVTVQQIMAVNPGIADPNTLSVGQVIKVPCPGLG